MPRPLDSGFRLSPVFRTLDEGHACSVYSQPFPTVGQGLVFWSCGWLRALFYFIRECLAWRQRIRLFPSYGAHSPPARDCFSSPVSGHRLQGCWWQFLSCGLHSRGQASCRLPFCWEPWVSAWQCLGPELGPLTLVFGEGSALRSASDRVVLHHAKSGVQANPDLGPRRRHHLGLFLGSYRHRISPTRMNETDLPAIAIRGARGLGGKAMTSYMTSETLASGAGPAVGFTDATLGRWMRSCPMCNLLLSKRLPWETVQCDCGWQWRS